MILGVEFSIAKCMNNKLNFFHGNGLPFKKTYIPNKAEIITQDDSVFLKVAMDSDFYKDEILENLNSCSILKMKIDFSDEIDLWVITDNYYLKFPCIPLKYKETIKQKNFTTCIEDNNNSDLIVFSFSV